MKDALSINQQALPRPHPNGRSPKGPGQTTCRQAKVRLLAIAEKSGKFLAAPLARGLHQSSTYSVRAGPCLDAKAYRAHARA